jgi:hypothetical protein
MATTKPDPKPKKPPVPLVHRLSEQLKRGAVTNKLTAQELDGLAKLAESLKVFVSAA